MSSEKKPKWEDWDRGVQGTFVRYKETSNPDEVKPVIFPINSNIFDLLFGRTFTYPDVIRLDEVHTVRLPLIENYKGQETDIMIHVSDKNIGIAKAIQLNVLNELSSSKKRILQGKLQNTKLQQELSSSSQGEAKIKADKDAREGKSNNNDYNPFNRFGGMNNERSDY